MTKPPPDRRSLRDIITATRYLLLDFDGPICDIYAGVPDITVADHLRKLIAAQDVAIPADIVTTPDPLAVFTWSATISPELAAQVEAEMTEQETVAVPTATPNGYVHEVAASCRESGRGIAVVSNNSARAVRAYLERHGLDDRIDLIAARTSPDPALLKPNPHLIDQAIRGLAAQPEECALVGDSITDIQAGHHANVATIGYANRPGKRDSLASAGATAVILSLADLVLPLRANRPSNP